MRAALITAALLLVSCAAADTPTQHKNQPHLPPPSFPVNEAPDTVRYCGVRQVGGGETCGTGEFCRREIKDICGAADAPGICSPIPEACTQDYSPVCGCDGETYSNACAANAKGVSASYVGPCKP